MKYRPKLALLSLVVCLTFVFPATSISEIGLREGVVSSKKLPSPQKAKSIVLLDVPHMKQGHDMCVPTSSSMILAYYGENHKPLKLKNLAENHKPPSERNSFTLWSDMDVALKSVGHRWQQKWYKKTSTGFSQGLRDIKRHLRKGYPVMIDVDLEGPEGHTFVVIGYDDARKVVFIRDPLLNKNQHRILSYSKLRSDWHNHRYADEFGAWRGAYFSKPRR